MQADSRQSVLEHLRMKGDSENKGNDYEKSVALCRPLLCAGLFLSKCAVLNAARSSDQKDYKVA